MAYTALTYSYLIGFDRVGVEVDGKPKAGYTFH